MSGALHPAASHHVPSFIVAPGETDILMVVVAVFLLIAVLAVGILFLRLHTLPERLAHRGHKLQFEIVAVLGLIALFTHQHIFWVAGLLLAIIDLPDFGTPLSRMARSLERLAGDQPTDQPQHHMPTPDPAETADARVPVPPASMSPPARARPVLTPVGSKEGANA